jgi:hypothetical protein
VPAVTLPPASARVRAEWRARIAAEYGSAAITQHLVLWLIQLGAPPEVIDDGLRIVKDELEHSRLSHATYVAAGGGPPPALDRATLGLVRRPDVPLELDVLRVGVQVFALGETVAVPLFKHLRDRCSAPPARAALDRILRDEVRHRDFGWTLIDWLATTPLGDQLRPLVLAELPAMFALLELNYGDAGAGAAVAITDEDRAWGLAPAEDYAQILRRTFDRDYLPRFTARGIDPVPAWSKRSRATQGRTDLRSASLFRLDP